MQFNSSKCHILSVSHQRNPTLVSYYLGPDKLSSVDSYPYLGITISSDLYWDKHVSAVSSKATRYLNFIRHNIDSCPPDVKSLAYTSLVRPTGCGKKVIPCRIFQIFKQRLRIFSRNSAITFSVHTDT